MNAVASDEGEYTCEAVTIGVDGSRGKTVALTPVPERQLFCSKCDSVIVIS